MPPSTTVETLPGLVSRNLEQCPLDPFYVYASLESNDIVTISQLEFGRATYRAAHLLRPNREGQDGKVVAILAESDTMVYTGVVVGLMTANFVPFPISPRNSAPAILQLLRASGCHHIIATRITLAVILERLEQHVAEVDPDFQLDIQEVPSLQQLYPNLGRETSDHVFQPYPTDITHQNPGCDDLLMYIHSSGSTGFPKSIPWNYRMLQHIIALSTTDVRRQVELPVAMMGLPPFHIFGLASQLIRPLSGIYAAVFPPTATTPDALPMSASPDRVLEHARRTKAQSLTAVPAFLVTWFNSPEAFEYLKTMQAIIWGGGPLPQRVGDAYITAGVRLFTGYGTTETGAIGVMSPYEEDFKDWEWFRISERVKVRWVPQGDGTFECQVLATDMHVPLVLNLPDVEGYATSDLCVNHPTKKHLWRIVGRLDDTLVHTSGEKTVPTPLENIITGSPLVKGAVVFGHERPQTGILLELTEIDVKDASQLAELRNKVWPVIEEANAIAPGFSRIFKEMMLFTSVDKPLPRAGKGTVLRKAAITLYTSEIDALYNEVEENAVSSIEPPTVWNVEAIQPWLMEVAASVCNFTTISSTMDLRQQGFDSLSATVFRLHITKGLRSRQLDDAASVIPQQLVYARPTISELSSFLEALVAGTLTEAEITAAPQVETAPAPTSETVVELRSDGGIPFIVFPGVRGTLESTEALRANFPGTIWGIQITQTTPIEPFSALAAFLAAEIRAKRPKGPYRLVGYSASSVVVVAVSKLLEDAGEEVIQLSFIDHFPLLWTMEPTFLALRDEEAKQALVDATGARVTDLASRDPLYGPDSDRVKMLKEAMNVTAESEADENGEREVQVQYMSIRRRTMASLLDFLATFLPTEDGAESATKYADAFNRWFADVKAPLSAVTAEFGIAATMGDEARKEWGDLGILRDRRTAAFLQNQDDN